MIRRDRQGEWRAITETFNGHKRPNRRMGTIHREGAVVNGTGVRLMKKKMSVGVDLHKSQFTVSYLGEDREIEYGTEYNTGADGYESFCQELRAYKIAGYDVRVAVESTGNTRYFRNQVWKEDVDVLVVNTLKFKVVNESVKKTDKHDARTLAEFLEKDMLPESILCSTESEILRRIANTRKSFVDGIVQLKNEIHGQLVSCGIESMKASLQSKKGRQRVLKDLEDQGYGHVAEVAVKPLIESIEVYEEQVKKYEGILKELTAEDEDVQLLLTIPGVGLITASTIRAYTDDIGRFENKKKYASYMGLAPWVQNSNETVRHGHVTKRGPVQLRTAYVQAVLGMVRNKKRTAGYRIMNRYGYMKKHKGSGKSIVATARKLSNIVYAMLTERRAFDPEMMYDTRKYKHMEVVPCTTTDAERSSA